MNLKKTVTEVLSDTKLLLSILVVLTFYLTPALVYCVILPDRILTLLLLILEGFWAARIIRHAGIFLLREPVNPWYSRSYSLAFLLISGFFTNIFIMSIDCVLSDIIAVSNNIPCWARTLALTPIEFAWIILLDWRSGFSASNNGSNWTYIPQNPHFRQ